MTEQEIHRLARGYEVSIVPDPDEVYIALIPLFPDVYTNGKTPEEALAHAYEAIELTIEDMIAHGEPLPPTRVAV
ncbi:MAG: type II toxin-antitoxin system HicB family antitoxin [Armatimonadetes bacterium]|nr:type II toxin-antitoxin system HicB family antitoxin [Armatimonadota bacterium]